MIDRSMVNCSEVKFSHTDKIVHTVAKKNSIGYQITT